MTSPDIRFASAAGRWVLLATVLGSGIAQLDATVTNVALPRIGLDLHAGITGLQWTVNAYTLTLSGLLLLGGALGDRLGRRAVFAVGVTVFALASAACAAAPNIELLVGMRALQGVGGALLTPGSLAIIEAVFVPAERARAVGAWSGLSGVAAAVGPVVGGVLVGLAPWGWRLVFLINIPLAAVVLLATRRLPETRDEEVGGRLDISGAALAAAGLAGLVFGLTEGAAHGFAPTALFTTVAGAAVLLTFLVVEARRATPLLPPSLFRSRQFSVANLATLTIYAAFGGSLFLLPVQLQRGSGESPLLAGTALLPVTAVMLLLSARAGQLASRVGPRLPMTLGPIVAGIGLAMLARVGPNVSYVGDVLPAVLVFALGVTTTVAPLTATVLAAAPVHQVGVASAVNNDVARVGGLLAVALLPALAGITSTVYHSPAALSTGFHRAMFICAGLCLVGGLVSLAGIRGRIGEGAEEPIPAGAVPTVVAPTGRAGED